MLGIANYGSDLGVTINYGSDISGLGSAITDTGTTDIFSNFPIESVSPQVLPNVTFPANDLTNLPLTLGNSAAVASNPLTSGLVNVSATGFNPLTVAMYVVGGILILELFKK